MWKRCGLALLALLVCGGCQNPLSGSPRAASSPAGATAAEGAPGAGAPPEAPPEGLEGIDPELLKPGPWEFTGYVAAVGLPRAGFRARDWAVHTWLSRVRLKARKKVGLGASVQVDGVYERRDYNFDGPTEILAGTYDPVTVVNGFGLRVRYLQPFHPEWAVYVAGRTRLEAERGAPLSDGLSWGAFLAIGHRFPFGLDLGVGAGYLERPGSEELWLPVVQFDWTVSDVVTVSLDGLELSVEARTSDAWSWGVVGGFDSARIRLADEAPSDSGIFTDSRFTVQLRSTWTPVEDLDIELRLGMDVYRELFFADRNGDNSTSFRLKPAPVVGLRFAVRF